MSWRSARPSWAQASGCARGGGWARTGLRRAAATLVPTRPDLPIEVVAYRMFERWTQENFFRYMRQHFALDALVTYAVEPADPERTVPNPERTGLGQTAGANR